MSRRKLIELMARAINRSTGNYAVWQRWELEAEAALDALEMYGVTVVPMEATSPMVENGSFHALARHMPTDTVQDNYEIARAQWRAMLSANPYKE